MDEETCWSRIQGGSKKLLRVLKQSFSFGTQKIRRKRSENIPEMENETARDTASFAVNPCISERPADSTDGAYLYLNWHWATSKSPGAFPIPSELERFEPFGKKIVRSGPGSYNHLMLGKSRLSTRALKRERSSHNHSLKRTLLTILGQNSWNSSPLSKNNIETDC